MGNNPFCDFCRKTVPVETALQPVKVGDELIGEACLTCGSAIKTSTGKIISDAEALMRKAAETTEAAQAAAPPAPTPPPVEDLPPAPAEPPKEKK